MTAAGYIPAQVRRKPTPWPLVAVYMVGAVLLSPVLVPIAAWQVKRTKKRCRVCAQQFGCPRCGKVLGQTAMDAADAAWAEHVQRLHREHPTMRFRLNRTVDAVCTRCGETFCFDEGADAFRVVSEGG